jgi:hypothetical protein
MPTASSRLAGASDPSGRFPRVRRRLVALFVLLAALVLPLAVAHPTPVGAAVPKVTIGLHCLSTPETTRVTHTTAATITVETVGSLYRPRSNEPFTVNTKLGAGKSITYQTGAPATSHVLTHHYIYGNTATSEGARVATSVGTFTKKC